ncbi:hypothetical protein I204_08162 [Kwoniella mangroviensis CBS 8886]|nr:hypothetical protein I204_08162 [Kwoniella mangroviensis CBS 8886]
MSSSAAASQNAATPQSSVAAASTSAAASSAAAATSSAAGSSASQASASASASASAAASSTAASASASGSSSAAASPTSASTSTSQSASSSSSSSATASTTVLSADVITTTGSSATSSSTKSLSGGAIGGIVAGAIVGIIVVFVFAWIWKRKRRSRGEKVPPPPPMRHAQSSMSRSRQSTMMGGGMNHQRRTSTYSASMAPPRPSSTFASHSRSPSSHINYPITTMASMNHDASPPMPPSTSSTSSDSPPLSTGANIPAHPFPSPAAGHKPTLTPIDTSLSRGGSASSDDLRGGHKPRRVASIDRLRGEGNQSGNGSERAPSPASSRHPSESGVDYSRGNSPHTSMIGLPSSGGPGRNSYPSPRSSIGYPRPGSMASLGSSRYLHVGPAGRAPHQGRPIQLTMPTLLGARPDENGDFFGQTGRLDGGYQLGLDEMGRMRRMSNRQYNEQDYQPSPIHTRAPSNTSLSNRSRQGSDEGNVPPIPELSSALGNSGPPSRNQTPTPVPRPPPKSDVADPHTVLQRE